MISLYPSLYDTFTCKADSCKKTCCQRWEIDIDPETLAVYKKEEGALGDELRQWIEDGPEGAHFSFETSGYCHFLREDGLCRLVLAKGEDYLCQICHAHPRFYAYLGDLELCGVGLACEASVEGLLADRRLGYDSEWVPWEDDQLHLREVLDQESIDLLAADSLDTSPRQDLGLGDILLDLGLVGPETYSNPYGAGLNFQLDLDLNRAQTALTIMGATDPIDQAWTKTLETMGQTLDILLGHLDRVQGDQPLLRRHLNRFYQYIMYRQLPYLEELAWADLVAYGQLNTLFVALLGCHYGDLAKAMVDWSEQIEYDTDNVDRIFMALNQL